MSFAAALGQVVVDKKKAQQNRALLAEKWTRHETRLLETASEAFQQRCVEAAEQQKTEATISFEALTRSMPEFPARVLKDATYLVKHWGKDVDAECWFYASRGTANACPEDHRDRVLFAELLEGMMPKFVGKLQSLGFNSCVRQDGTWKISVCWSLPLQKATSLSLLLAETVVKSKTEGQRRRRIADNWEKFEAELVDKAVDIYKQRCTAEAQKQKTEATISFDMITREIPEFPRRLLRDSNYLVDTSTDLESWHYASRGLVEAFSPERPVFFAELLDRMMPKFVDKLQSLGFTSCNRLSGSWKVCASWDAPKDEDTRRKRRRMSRESAVAGA